MFRSPPVAALLAFAFAGLLLLALPVALAFFFRLPDWAPFAVSGGAVVGLALLPSPGQD